MPQINCVPGDRFLLMNAEDYNGKVLFVSGACVSLFSFLQQSHAICFKFTLSWAGTVTLETPAGHWTRWAQTPAHKQGDGHRVGFTPTPARCSGGGPEGQCRYKHPSGRRRQKQPLNPSSHPALVLGAKPTLPADLLSRVGQPRGQLWEMLLLKSLKVKLTFPRVKISSIYLLLTRSPAGQGPESILSLKRAFTEKLSLWNLICLYCILT